MNVLPTTKAPSATWTLALWLDDGRSIEQVPNRNRTDIFHTEVSLTVKPPFIPERWQNLSKCRSQR